MEELKAMVPASRLEDIQAEKENQDNPFELKSATTMTLQLGEIFLIPESLNVTIALNQFMKKDPRFYAKHMIGQKNLSEVDMIKGFIKVCGWVVVEVLHRGRRQLKCRKVSDTKKKRFIAVNMNLITTSKVVEYNKDAANNTEN